MIIFLVGLSGSGKTTIASEIIDVVQQDAIDCIHLDGDQLRAVFSACGEVPDCYDARGREINSLRVMELCKLLDRQNKNIVVSMLSIFPEHRRNLRNSVRHYFEVYLKTDLASLKKRDYKGLYSGLQQGEYSSIVGVDIQFPEPDAPNIVVESYHPPVNSSEVARLIVQESGIRNLRG